MYKIFSKTIEGGCMVRIFIALGKLNHFCFLYKFKLTHQFVSLYNINWN